MNLADTFIQADAREQSERAERERERKARQRAALSRARNEVAEAALSLLGLTDAEAVDCGPNWYHATGYVVGDIRIRGHLVSNYAAPSDLTTAHEISVDPYCEDCAQFVTAWGSVTTRYLEPHTVRMTPTVEQLRVKIGQSIRQTRANHAPRCPGVLDIYNDPLIG